MPPQPPEYYLSSKSNIHFVVSWNPTTAAFLHVGKNNPVNPVDLVYNGGMKTFIERTRLFPVPFEVNLNLTPQKLPRTVPRKNPTTIVFSEFFKYCKIIQNLAIIAQKPLIYRLSPSFQKISISQRFLVFHQNISDQQKKKKILYLSAFYDFSPHFFTELTKSNQII